MKLKGALIASVVAGLFSLGMGSDAFAQEKDTDKVKCEGVNACKGQGACEGMGHSCAGKNACKGQGWIKNTRKECTDKGGKVLAEKKKDEGTKK
jgi:uncharacterized membrane protein